MMTTPEQLPARPLQILMLLSNAFDPDPRVHREARALVVAGHRVTILCWDRDRKTKKQETIDGIELQRIYLDSTHGRGASQVLFLAGFWCKALAAARSKRFDVVHAHDFDTLPLGYALARLKRAKLVYDSHESYVDMIHQLPSAIRQTILHTENFLLKRSDLVITVGEILKDYLRQRGARNVCVVGNWQDPDKFIFSPEQIAAGRAELGIAPGKKVIAFIANLGTERRVSELIEAVSSNEDVFLLLGGKGPCAEFAAKAAQEQANIHYLGYVDPDRVPFYTALADMVFYGFDPDNPNARFSAPNKLFECLAGGKAMLTGDFGEIGRIVREENCGIVLSSYAPAEIGEALEKMTAGQLLNYGKSAAAAGRNTYSWQQAEKILLNEYANLTA